MTHDSPQWSNCLFSTLSYQDRPISVTDLSILQQASNRLLDVLVYIGQVNSNFFWPRENVLLIFFSIYNQSCDNLRPLLDVNFAINIMQAKKFIVRFCHTFHGYSKLTFSTSQHSPSPFAIQIRGKSVDLSPKYLFLGLETAFRHTFPSSDYSNICPLAIPEFFAHNKGIRLPANHSFCFLQF